MSNRKKLNLRELAPMQVAAPRGRIYGSVLQTVGGTPMVRLPRLAREERLVADLVLKLEFFNPLGSVKDRIGLGMVLQAEEAAQIAPGRTVLVEPTSGNTGIALAFVAAARGYRLIVTMPESASIERRRMLRLMDAQVELTPQKLGMAGAIARANEILASTPDAWMPRQFDNEANPAIHEATTAEEIWADTEGQVDMVVAGVGTGGTLTGIARALRPRRPGLRMIGVEPAESAVLSGDEPGPHGIQGIGPGFAPPVLDVAEIDQVITVSEREAIAASRRCARLEGLPIGISAGGMLHVALALARAPENEGKLIVGIVPSFAERYLSTRAVRRAVAMPSPPTPICSAIPTRWMDNDVYGHVNNVVYYSYFDTVINTYLIQHGGLGHPCRSRADRAVRGIALPICRAAQLPGERGGRIAGRDAWPLQRALRHRPVRGRRRRQPAAEGWFVHVFVDRATRRPAPIGEAMRAAAADN